jgi:hypothetical protein
MILDTEGNIFGGFTPVKWESRATGPYGKADPSLTSFLFTLKNPHNISARRFALKAEKKDEAICCDSDYGPWFFGGIRVGNECNAHSNSCTYGFGARYASYTNNTGLDGCRFFTGSDCFQVKETEVFEMTDETALPPNCPCVHSRIASQIDFLLRFFPLN